MLLRGTQGVIRGWGRTWVGGGGHRRKGLHWVGVWNAEPSTESSGVGRHKGGHGPSAHHCSSTSTFGQQALGSLHSFICPLASKMCLAHHLALVILCPKSWPCSWPCSVPRGAGSWAPSPSSFGLGSSRGCGGWEKSTSG